MQIDAKGKILNASEYRKYYLNLTQGTLGGNKSHFDCSIEDINERKAALEESRKYRQRQIAFSLVCFIETHFLNGNDLKLLRKFEHTQNIPPTIDNTHLSCFIYVRDCVGHHSPAKLFEGDSVNTIGFTNAINSGTFTFAKLNGNYIDEVDTHQLDQIILKFIAARSN